MFVYLGAKVQRLLKFAKLFRFFSFPRKEYNNYQVARVIIKNNSVPLRRILLCLAIVRNKDNNKTKQNT